MPTFKNPDFIKDKESTQYLCFAILLKKLRENFTANSPIAENEIINLIRDLCEASYIYEQLWRERRLMNQRLLIMPDESPADI